METVLFQADRTSNIITRKLYKEMIINLFTDMGLPVHLHRTECLLKLLLVWCLFFKCFVERFFWWLFCM